MHILNFYRRQKVENVELKKQMPVEDPFEITTIGSPRTKSDFEALKSKIRKWKEAKVNIEWNCFFITRMHEIFFILSDQ